MFAVVKRQSVYQKDWIFTLSKKVE